MPEVESWKNKRSKEVYPGSDLTEEQWRFGQAMDQYKRDHCRPYLTWLEVLNVAKDMGYRKVVALLAIAVLATCAPASRPKGYSLPWGEDFTSVGSLTQKGWTLRNNSSPGNPMWPTWFLGGQPPEAWFAQPRLGVGFGPPLGYLAANFRVCGGASPVAGTISLWAVSPPLRLPGDCVVEYTVRSAGNAPDFIQVLFAYGESADPGFTVDGYGDFQHLVDFGSPPADWETFSVDLLVTPGLGRLALRYYVTDSGPAGANGDYIGIGWLHVSEGLHWR